MRYASLLRTAYLLTGSTHAAEDLVQHVLLGIMPRWGQIDEPMSYLRRSMFNRQASVWRRLTSREIAGPIPEPSVADATETVARRDELLAALAKLPVKMRAVLVLRYWEDLSEADTARILNCSPGSVKAQASRGLTRLRSVLHGPVAARVEGDHE